MADDSTKESTPNDSCQIEKVKENEIEEVPADIEEIQKVAANFPPEVRRTLLQILHMRIGTAEEENNPLYQLMKVLSPADVSTIVNSTWVVGKKNKHEDRKSKRHLCFAGYVIALVFVGFMTYLLIPQNKEFLGEVAKTVAIFGGGFGAGFGLRRKRKK